MYQTTRIAIEAAAAAGKLLRECLHHQHCETIKKGGVFADVVTEADFASEKLINHKIQNAFPNHGILAEETQNKINPRKHKHLWIVDPIDGTIAFASGLPFYSVSIAYTVDRTLISSALYMASTNDVLWAEIGKGAFCGKKRLKVRSTAWTRAVIALDPGNTFRTQALSKITPALAKDIRFLQITPGEAGNLGFVAQGKLQGLVCVYPDVWDYAAGMLLVQEAGGVMSDLQGKPYPLFSQAGHVAASPTIHKRIIALTKSFFRQV